MINFIRRLLGLCVHEWTEWEPYLSGLYYQRRRCKKCGLTQEKTI